MAYKKVLVDNMTCLRRFHITFDDEQKPITSTQIKCLHCGAVVFSKSNHPPTRLARDENIIDQYNISPLRTKTCNFKDQFSPPSQLK